MGDFVNVCLTSCQKVFVERDYRHGFYGTRFMEQMPEQLHNCVPYDDWIVTIKTINDLLEELEAVSAKSILRTTFSILTCTVGDVFNKAVTSAKRKEILDFIHRRNKEVFHSAGFHIDNPFDCGLRMIQISILSTGKILDR
uniref:Ras modification protein ERF4 n=1 Tax=Parastrongyloides trichosuri TaxID=131310 RepID=A0A0N5A372_PARTI